MAERDKDSYSIQAVDNAMDLLEVLCEEDEGVRISYLSEKLGMNKTSVFRLLATFENRGYVEKIKGSGKYSLGISAYEMGQKFLSRMNILRKARPVMEKLAREINEAIYLVIRRDDQGLFLDVADTTHQVKIISLVGKKYPLKSFSAGQVILAGTGGTETLHLSDQGNLGEGITSLSVPLIIRSGDVPAALCIVGPSYRMPRDAAEERLIPRLKEAGDVISSKLGYVGHYLGTAAV